MTPLIEFMETLKRTAEENCCLGSEISLDELPAGGGIYAEPGEGSTADTTCLGDFGLVWRKVSRYLWIA